MNRYLIAAVLTILAASALAIDTGQAFDDPHGVLFANFKHGLFTGSPDMRIHGSIWLIRLVFC